MITLQPVAGDLKIYSDAVGTPVTDLAHDVNVLAQTYVDLLMGTYVAHLVRGCKTEDEVKQFCDSNKEVILKRINAMVDWLKRTDLFEAPASTKYHDAFPGGLVYHSLKVYNNMIDLINTKAFHSVDIVSASLVALVHDWCKTNYYKPYQKNVKDDNTGQWHQELAWSVDQQGVPLGHGVSSMFLAQKFFNLTTEEALAIRWHMGRWNACEIELGELQKANEKVPLVYMLQFADQLACTVYC